MSEDRVPSIPGPGDLRISPDEIIRALGRPTVGFDAKIPAAAKKVYLIELEPIEDGWLGTAMPPDGKAPRKVFGADAGEALDKVKGVIADWIVSKENE